MRDDNAAIESGVSFSSLDPDGDDRFQWLRRELGISSFGLSLMRLRPGQRNRIHRHLHQEEAYLVLEGTLTLRVENEQHELANRGPEPLLLIALGGAHPHESRDSRAYESWDEEGEGRPPQEVPHPHDLPV